MGDTIFFIFNDLGIGGVQRKIVDSVLFLRKDSKFRKKSLKIVILLENSKSYDLEEDIFLKEIEDCECEIYYYRSKTDIDFSYFHIPFTFFVSWKIFMLRPAKIMAFMEPYAVSAIVGKLLYQIFRRGYVKVIVGFDNVASLLLKLEYGGNWRYYYWLNLLKHLFKLADRIVVPSNFSKADLVNNFQIPENQITVNKNWVSIPRRLKIRPKKYDLLYVGRVDKVKNLKLFLDVVDELRIIKPNIKACIVGWGDEMEDILHYSVSKKLTNTVDLAGSQRDVRFYYSQSSIFLITSDFEGLPLVGLEAMAWGLPIVSTNYSGSDELVINGKTGFICDTKREIMEKILLLLSDAKKRKKMGRQARVQIVRHHNKKALRNFVETIVS